MTEKDFDFLDICVTEQEREIAQSALAEFNKTNYASCLQYLSKLESRQQDPKLCLNRAVAEFYKSDQKKTETFKKNLATVVNLAKIKPDVVDDVEQCVIHYNQAILLYHQKKYNDALMIVDKVYKFIEPMEETLARRVCLLLIDLHIIAQHHAKALTLITCIENQFVNMETKGSGAKDKEKDKDKKEQKVEIKDPNIEIFRIKLMKYRVKCYLMSHALKSAKREIKSIASIEGSNTSTLCFRAHLEYLKGNHKNAIKIFNSSPTDNINFKDHGESTIVIFYNNMGVIHHAMGKANLACHYFRQALKEDQAAVASVNTTENGESTQPLYTLGSSRYHEIMYNLGISLLYAGHPLQAFDCLITAVQRFHRNSRLWLRIAECCIQVHKPNNDIDFNSTKNQKNIIENIVGSGKHRKIILNSHLSKDRKYSTEMLSYAVPVANLEFASLCLRNALLLLPSRITTSPVPLLLLPGGVQPPPPPPSPGPAPASPLSLYEMANLKNSVLITSAYVSLCLGDYVLTLEHAQNVLAQPKISGVHKLLGHLYAAEALVLMNKLSDAIEHLDPDLISDISLTVPHEETNEDEEIATNTRPQAKWFLDNLDSAHAVLQYNLAVALTIRKEFEKAGELLKKIWQTKRNSSSVKLPTHIVMLYLYIELQLGHADGARTFIKQYCSSHR